MCKRASSLLVPFQAIRLHISLRHSSVANRIQPLTAPYPSGVYKFIKIRKTIKFQSISKVYAAEFF